MGWATGHIAKLKAGETVRFRPHGNSMRGRINSGDLCTVEPVNAPVEPGDVVLCKVNGNQYLHLVKAVQGQRILIGNNVGGTNGWIGPNAVYGKLVAVER